MGGERKVKKLMGRKQGGRGNKVISRLRCKNNVKLDLRNVGVNLVRTRALERVE
jgi:hypothetical protein